MVLHLKVRKSRSPPGPHPPSLPSPSRSATDRRDPTNAGWSSPVARQAHNLKVVGSNPTPATNDPCGSLPRSHRVLRVPATDNACDSKLSESPASRAGAPGFFLFDAKLNIAARSPRNTIASSPFSGVSSIALTSERITSGLFPRIGSAQRLTERVQVLAINFR